MCLCVKVLLFVYVCCCHNAVTQCENTHWDTNVIPLWDPFVSEGVMTAELGYGAAADSHCGKDTFMRFRGVYSLIDKYITNESRASVPFVVGKKQDGCTLLIHLLTCAWFSNSH